VSAKTGSGVSEMFKKLAEGMVSNVAPKYFPPPSDLARVERFYEQDEKRETRICILQ